MQRRRRPSPRNSARARRGTFAGLILGLLGAGSVLPASANDLPPRLEGHGGPVRSITMSDDGKQALTTSFDYTGIFWALEGESGRIVKRLYGHDSGVNDAVFVGRDKAVTVSDDGSLAFWDLVSGELIRRIQASGDKILDVAVSDDGRHVATAGWDRLARVYDTDNGAEVATMSEHRGNVNAVAFSPDGQVLYTGSYDGMVRSWDVASGDYRQRLDNHGWGINVLARLADGKLIAGALDGSAFILDPERGERVFDLEQHKGPVLAVAISPSGSLVATGGADGHIMVQRTDGGGLVEQYENPYGPVWSIAFAGSDQQLYYSGLDDFPSLWTVTPRKPFEAVQSAFPRRFQLASEDDLGKRQFARKCSVCHTLDRDGEFRAGPTLFALFGRRVGAIQDYPYSEALAEADFVWNEETIDKLFDLGPHEFTPGSKMPIQRITDRKKREALIAFLKRATDPDADPAERREFSTSRDAAPGTEPTKEQTQ